MIHVAVAEDDPNCAKQLEQFLREFGRESGRTFQITHYDNAVPLLVLFLVYGAVFVPCFSAWSASGARPAPTESKTGTIARPSRQARRATAKPTDSCRTSAVCVPWRWRRGCLPSAMGTTSKAWAR